MVFNNSNNSSFIFLGILFFLVFLGVLFSYIFYLEKGSLPDCQRDPWHEKIVSLEDWGDTEAVVKDTHKMESPVRARPGQRGAGPAFTAWQGRWGCRPGPLTSGRSQRGHGQQTQAFASEHSYCPNSAPASGCFCRAGSGALAAAAPGSSLGCLCGDRPSRAGLALLSGAKSSRASCSSSGPGSLSSGFSLHVQTSPGLSVCHRVGTGAQGVTPQMQTVWLWQLLRVMG